MKKYSLIIALLFLVVLASGCIDDGTTTNTTSQSNTQTQSTTQQTLPQTSNLVLTITESEGSSSTYSSGDTINVNFDTSDSTFTLSDRYGTYYGKYYVSENTITLDFNNYDPWMITLAADGTFTGKEANKYSDKGTYKWT